MAGSNSGKAGKKRRENAGLFIMGVIYGISGFISAFYFVLHLSDDLSFFAYMALVMLFIYASATIQIIIHESGHLAGGLLSGYKFCSFRVFNIMLVSLDGKIKVRRYSVMGMGGQCLMGPPEPYCDGIPVILYNLGGVLLNLVTAAIALVIVIIIGKHTYITSFLVSLASIGIAIALVTGIPLRMGGVNNDGKNALELTKVPAAKRHFWIQLQIVKSLCLGVRLKNMPDEWFYVPSHEEMKNSLAASVGVFACNRAMDALDYEATQKIGFDLLENAEGLLGLHRNYLLGDLVFCELIGENRELEINKLTTKDVNKYQRAMANHVTTIRNRYAHELLFNLDEKAAEDKLKRFEKAAKRHPYPCEIEGERELINAARQRFLDATWLQQS